MNVNVHWGSTGSNGSCSVVLGGKDVAARPGQLCTECFECLDQDCGLNG